MQSGLIQGLAAGYFEIATESSGSATIPIYRFNDDVDTGIGRGAADQLSLIAGATELMRLTEDTANAIALNATTRTSSLD